MNTQLVMTDGKKYTVKKIKVVGNKAICTLNDGQKVTLDIGTGRVTGWTWLNS